MDLTGSDSQERVASGVPLTIPTANHPQDSSQNAENCVGMSSPEVSEVVELNECDLQPSQAMVDSSEADSNHGESVPLSEVEAIYEAATLGVDDSEAQRSQQAQPSSIEEGSNAQDIHAFRLNQIAS